MKNNREITIEELKKIHGEYMVAKALATISGEYYKNEDEWKDKFFEPLATNLLSKLQTLDRGKVEDLMEEHQVKNKEEAYQNEDFIEAILQLIPKEGVKKW